MRVTWSFQAQDDLLDIAEYYDAIDPALANEIVRQVEDAAMPLVDFPMLGPAVSGHEPIRKWRIPRTPFVLLYDVVDDRVEVRSVVHTARGQRT